MEGLCSYDAIHIAQVHQGTNGLDSDKKIPRPWWPIPSHMALILAWPSPWWVSLVLTCRAGLNPGRFAFVCQKTNARKRATLSDVALCVTGAPGIEMSLDTISTLTLRD